MPVEKHTGTTDSYLTLVRAGPLVSEAAVRPRPQGVLSFAGRTAPDTNKAFPYTYHPLLIPD
jgi:hypothetical protein